MKITYEQLVHRLIKDPEPLMGSVETSVVIPFSYAKRLAMVEQVYRNDLELLAGEIRQLRQEVQSAMSQMRQVAPKTADEVLKT